MEEKTFDGQACSHVNNVAINEYTQVDIENFMREKYYEFTITREIPENNHRSLEPPDDYYMFIHPEKGYGFDIGGNLESSDIVCLDCGKCFHGMDYVVTLINKRIKDEEIKYKRFEMGKALWDKNVDKAERAMPITSDSIKLTKEDILPSNQKKKLKVRGGSWGNGMASQARPALGN